MKIKVKQPWTTITAYPKDGQVRVTIPLREHRRKRIQKKWLRRYGSFSFSIPSEVIQAGTREVSRFLYRTRRSARATAAFLQRERRAGRYPERFRDVDPSEQRLLKGVDL